MSWAHLSTVLWLRWRIRANQIKRYGSVNAVITAILYVLLLVFAASSFVGAMPIGKYLLADVRPVVLMLVWDGIVVSFLFCWMIGVITELQRSESLSPDKFLHLPVTLSGVFLVNYVSSLFSLSSIVFVPAMLGLAIGLAAGRGFSMLWALPLIAAFFLMLTALTYQLRGWLAAMMSNPRRRRTIIVGLTIGLVLIAQTPNVINLWASDQRDRKSTRTRQSPQEILLNAQRAAGAMTQEEFLRQQAELKRAADKEQQAKRQVETDQFGHWARRANQVLPPGWLPWGVVTAAEGGWWQPLLAIAGMVAIGMASLARAYRTTIRYYTGQFNSKQKAAPAAATPPVRTVSRSSGLGRPTLLERRLPWVSEHAAAVAVSGLRSLLRAPEAKMMLLSPVILALLFGSMLFRDSMNLAQQFRPLLGIGAVAMTLFGMVQFVGNQFGFDREGFRVFVLSPAARRDILIGKNLAMAPLALGISYALIMLIQVLRPMRWDHFLAMFPQTIAMYLVFCLMSNWLSILAPMTISAGSMKPRNPRLSVILIHVLFTFAIPFAVAPTLLPWLAEYFVAAFGFQWPVPLFLAGAVVAVPLFGLLYWALVSNQGELLQHRELAILEVVTKKAE